MLSWIGLGILILTALVLVLMDDPGGAIGIGKRRFCPVDERLSRF